MAIPIRLACCLLASSLTLAPELARAEAVVTLQSGQILKADTAEFSADGQLVVLESRREGILIRRRVSRSLVTSIDLGETSVPHGDPAASISTPAFARDEGLPPEALPETTLPPIPSFVPSSTLSADGIVGVAGTIPQPGVVVGQPLAPLNEKQFAGWPTAGVVVGIRQDPLDAYGSQMARWYPQGVPQLEAGFARQLFRNDAAYQVAPPWAFNTWNTLPGTTNPGYGFRTGDSLVGESGLRHSSPPYRP
ncbi:MAG: hypothetical protein C0478_05625 [Planctomyces sp.]|nr:hypothetical protein [Planctomyces sp.]